MTHHLTCRSCSAYRLTGCHHGLSGWPTARLDTCKLAQYEPGADEAEDYVRDDQPTEDEETDAE
jgi:hypothetical protein